MDALTFVTATAQSTAQFIGVIHSLVVLCSVDEALVWDLESMQGVDSSKLRGIA